MSIALAFLSEFEQESLTTQAFIERVPAGKLDWKPHVKSMSAGQLALHIALAQGIIIEMMLCESCPLPDFTLPQRQPTDKQEILTTLELSAMAVRSYLQSASDESLKSSWKATKNGATVLIASRMAMLRMLLFNHIYHHRGQLGVYLRLLGESVPSSYGPSADEAPGYMV